MNVAWLQKIWVKQAPSFRFGNRGIQKNFDGSSGSMEMHAAYILWNRSISDCAMRYTTVLCDGDAKTHQHLNEKKVYGDDVVIVKEECVNHVAKRLGTALRNKVKEWRSKGVTLGGRKQGSLTDATITKLQNFYRKAIVDNVPEVEKMKASIFATLFHCMSTDAKPMHSKCPDGKLSWCFYNRAKTDNKVPGSHKSMKTKLSEEVVAKIMPVYQRLASNEILLRCVSGKTQNANESLHSCIWRKCPKDVFVSKKRIDLAVTAAVSEVNIGYVETLKLNNTEMVDAAFKIAHRRDNRRRIPLAAYHQLGLLIKEALRHGPIGPPPQWDPRLENKTKIPLRREPSALKDYDSNNFNGHMLFPVVFSKKLGFSEDMSTGSTR
ncbi:uncharacterized protein TNCV_346321 [Trichonephila clavipes]|nr:uncharacterized protein TNCV_346321 [Trichonephila clavipes]